MTETDFFRLARERMGDYCLTITRDSTLGQKPYSLVLQFKQQVFSARAETLPAALADLAGRAGVDRRKKPRDPASDKPTGARSSWPGE